MLYGGDLSPKEYYASTEIAVVTKSSVWGMCCKMLRDKPIGKIYCFEVLNVCASI